ncbi:hypothetical protein [Candidatus Chlorohelix sp.]|uniref:hypothetical protein n=1 Tax=Candidatus Chlorohelix sp. TaxID=3139201 RepID=UPI003033D165
MSDQTQPPSKKTTTKRKTKRKTSRKTIEKDSNLIRPDPMFKEVTTSIAKVVGINQMSIELPQLLRADLILAVPEGKDLSGTLFDFLLPYSIIEFKSTNDDFDRFEFAKNLARTHLFFSQYKKIPYQQLLTVFVCSEQPDTIIDYLKAVETPLESDPATPWLLRCRIWLLEVAIVVCRLLPLQERFYDWLQFAPATSVKWREFVTLMLLKGEKNQLEVIMKLHLKEFRLMRIDIKEHLKELSPEQRKEYEEELLGFAEDCINDLGELNPQMAKRFISGVKPEIRLAGLTPEQRLEGLTPEQVMAKFTPEQLQKYLDLITQRTNPPNDENQPKN